MVDVLERDDPLDGVGVQPPRVNARVLASDLGVAEEWLFLAGRNVERALVDRQLDACRPVA